MFEHKTGNESVFFPGTTSPITPQPSQPENNLREASMKTAKIFLKYYPWMIGIVVFLHVGYLIFLNAHPDIRSTNGGRVIDDVFILFGELVILSACIFAL